MQKREGHASLALIDEEDISLVPDPGYPVYSAGCNFSGGEIFKMPLKESLGWKPDLNDIPEAIAKI